MSNWQNRILSLDHVDPKTLIENPLNFKEHPDLQRRMMEGILDDVGWVDTVLVNKRTGHVIDGHMRLKLAIERGEATVPVLYIDVDEEEESNILATLDPVGTFAKERSEMVSSILENVNTKNANVLDLLERVAKRNRVEFGRYDPDEKKADKEKRKADEDEALQDLTDELGIKDGQVWKVKSKSAPDMFHRLMCGDSADKSAVKKFLGNTHAFLMVTDPPYGVDFSDQKFNPYAKDWDGIEGDKVTGVALREWFKNVLNIWMPFMDDKSAYYIWAAMFEEGFALYYSLKDVGLNVQSQIMWSKSHITLGQADYQWKHEICWYAFMKGKKHNWFGGRDQNTVWDVTKVAQGAYLHPMQKPVDLYSTPIRNHTKPGDICLDPFLGSGTQIIAAEQLGRICYGVEKDPKWVATTIKRLQEFGLEVYLE